MTFRTDCKDRENYLKITRFFLRLVQQQLSGFYPKIYLCFMAKTKKKNKSRIPLIITVVVLLAAAVALFKVFGPNAYKERFLYVRTGTTYAQLLQQLGDSNYISDATSFNLLAGQWKLPDHIHPGKYLIKKGMSNYQLVKHLRYGRQTPVKLVINKLRTPREFARLLGRSLEADSMQVLDMLNDNSFLSEFGLDSSSALCGVIPDTYEFYWNTAGDKAFRKILKNHKHFWTESRIRAAKAHNLTPIQAQIVASVVEEETNLSSDKPLIASVYLNRLQKGMRLQADPTVKYAIGDFTIKRVTGKMLQTESPYNTYRNAGLPPGPICTPMPSTVDAVLQAPATNYIYFCAKADLSGASVFAATDADHLKNARAYQKALNDRGIH